MSKSDRAFRALARAHPDVIVNLLQAVVPGFLPGGAVAEPDDVAPTQVDGLPPELDADWAARVANDDLVHMECQGYRDAGFSERVLWYHVGFALRHRRRRRVRTVALWLVSPPHGEPRHEVTAGDITVRVKTLVLAEVPASLLLADPAAACFAAGADGEGRTDDELCLAVATALKARAASWAERHMAVVAALTKGRYESMVNAMEQVDLEPVIIEDLVKFGEDRGLAKGRLEGLREGRLAGHVEGLREGLRRGQLDEERSTLRRVLAVRKLALDPDAERRIDACKDLETLRRWVDQAVLAPSAADALR